MGDRGKAAVLHSRGVVLVRDTARILGLRESLASSSVLRLLSRQSGDLWVAHTRVPNTRAATGVLQVVRDGRVVRTLPLNDASVATIGRWIEVPERNSVFAATQSGVIELGDDGSVTRRSQFPVAAIARGGPDGVIGAVGATVERWREGRFEPILFQVDHPDIPKPRFERERQWILL